MQNLKILNSKEIKNIRKQLKEQFGVEERFEFVYMINAKEKIYVVNREIEKLDLEKLRIDSIGVYFASIAKDGIRLSIEGSQIIGPFAKKNVFKISEEQFEHWLKGEDIEVEVDSNAFILVKYKDFFVGCGKIKEMILLNYVPKARRLIVVNN